MVHRIKRPSWVQGDIAVVPLTRGYVSIVDADDFSAVEGKNWYALTTLSKNHVYAARSVDGGVTLLHQVLLQNPPSDDMMVDHMSGDTLDNRRTNLRWATAQGNASNNRRSGLARSGFKGVFFDPRGARQWRATISINDRTKHLGRYVSPEDAARAYDAAAIRFFGEFAVTNHALGLLK